MRAQNSLTIQDQARFQRILKNLKLFKIFLKFFIPVNFLENGTKMIHYDELEFLKYEVDQVKDFIKTKSIFNENDDKTPNLLLMFDPKMTRQTKGTLGKIHICLLCNQ